MFRKLRNKFALTIILISSIIIAMSLSLVYFLAANSAENRNPFPKNAPNYTKEVRTIIDEHIHGERKEYLNSLSISLISTGITLEIIIAITSFILADKYIEPVKNAYETQKEFIANASHEIKTPVAAIQANLEAADIKDNHWIDNIEFEIAKIAKLNTELLILARNDLIIQKSTQEEIEIKKLVQKNIEKIKPRAESKKLIFSGQEKKIKIAKSDFEQVLNILLDNAIKYSDKKITIKLTEKSLEIKNDGKIIPKNELEKIFDRFYQTDKTSEGVGLGLSIAKTISDRNDWQLTANSTKTTTTFKLVFKS